MSDFSKLSCGLCKQFYASDRVPKYLRCGHMYCFPCLRLERNEGQIKCPLCQHITFVQHDAAIDALQSNLDIINFVRHIRGPTPPLQTSAPEVLEGNERGKPIDSDVRATEPTYKTSLPETRNLAISPHLKAEEQTVLPGRSSPQFPIVSTSRQIDPELPRGPERQQLAPLQDLSGQPQKPIDQRGSSAFQLPQQPSGGFPQISQLQQQTIFDALHSQNPSHPEVYPYPNTAFQQTAPMQNWPQRTTQLPSLFSTVISAPPGQPSATQWPPAGQFSHLPPQMIASGASSSQVSFLPEWAARRNPQNQASQELPQLQQQQQQQLAQFTNLVGGANVLVTAPNTAQPAQVQYIFNPATGTLTPITMMNVNDLRNLTLSNEQNSKPEEPSWRSAASSSSSTNNTWQPPRSKNYTRPANIPNARKQVLTILLLGETGAGKSTCVNGIANYIRYDNIHQALSGKLVSYIPSKFHITDDNYDDRCIEIGNHKNECFDAGKSATQKPQIYNFATDKYNVFLIDTPGIGDCDGLEQDKKNMSEILLTLGNFPTINAICLLMKSNDARLTMNLSYCLSELLMRLHRDAIDNICFFFTNCRGTFYRPGDSLTTLKTFLERLKKDRGVAVKTARENLFCLDNEAYRLVCAAHKGVRFSDEQKKDFAASWEHSAKEILRFLDFAASRDPHESKKTLSLNQARKLILCMAKPMADITQLTQDNVMLTKRYKADVQNTKAEISELRKKLKMPHEGFIVEELPHPVTVCTAPQCVQTRRIGHGNSLQTIYTQICHDHCYLVGVTRESFPEPALRNCAAMSGENCRHCRCNWSLHMHIYFKQTRHVEEIDDPKVSNAIAQGESAMNVKQCIIDEAEKKVQELEDEQRIIRQCSAYFAKFLQDSAIIPYNDIFEEHAKRIIEEERRMVALGADRASLDGLEESLRLYREERKAIDEAFANADNNVNLLRTDDVEKMLNDLFTLKHTGAELEQFFLQMKDGEHQQTRQAVVSMESRWGKPPSRGANIKDVKFPTNKSRQPNAPHVSPARPSPSTQKQKQTDNTQKKKDGKFPWRSLFRFFGGD